MSSKIKLVSKKGNTEIFIDGHKINGVRYVEFLHSTRGTIPILNLELVSTDITLDTDVMPTLSNGYKIVSDKDNVDLVFDGFKDDEL